MVAIELEVAGLTLKPAVMPAGQADVDSVTGPLKALTGVTAIALTPLEPTPVTLKLPIGCQVPD